MTARSLTGRALLDGALVPARVDLEGDKVRAVERLEGLDGADADRVIAPGFIDLHVHGFGGADPLEDLAGMAAALARAGTTAFQPTLFPRDPARLGDECEAAWRLAADLPAAGTARVAGLHLEGPFVNPLAAGALPVDDLATPSVEGLRRILGPATGGGRGVRTVTLAPELPGSADLVEELVRCGVRVSLGHSRATAAEARRATRAGAVGATHLFNAMPALHHREVGLTGVAMLDGTLFAEIIGDLRHVSAEAFELALAARGADGLCLVSDALRGAGTGCDVFHWHGRDHLVIEDTAFYPPREEGGEPQLAGSASSQLQMVRKLVARGVCSLADALTMAAVTPARALGLEGELGVLAPGRRADLVVLEGAELRLAEVLVGGAAPPGTA